MAGGRKPDYQVGIFNKETQEKGNVGAAWKSDKDDGRISIKLNVGVVLTQSPNWYITLFPNEGREERFGDKPRGAGAPHTRDEIDDEIPF